jgi:cytochrome P450
LRDRSFLRRGVVMSFLEEYDALPADQPAAKVGLVVKWLRTDWPGLYADLRANRPILVTPIFTMVVRATDVLDILSKPSLYSVRANATTMDPSVGPFMLARDETAINWHEKSIMRATLRWDDLPVVRSLAADTASQALADGPAGADLVPSVGRMVPLRIVQRHFGFAASDADLLAWSFATQHAMFRDLTGDPAVIAACTRAGEQMRAWLWPFLARKWAVAPSDSGDAVSRLINMSRLDDIALSPDRVLSNVCGLLVGAIETMSQAIVQAVDQLLLRPDMLAAARQAAMDGDDDTFDHYVFEALRFNPITTIQFRTAEADRELASGTPYATSIHAGARIAVCTGSAMFDADLMPQPSDFLVNRPFTSYLHFGLGHHECLGRYVAQVAIPEAVRQVVLKPGLRRKAGAAGQIDFAGGPFPEHFGVEWS